MKYKSVIVTRRGSPAVLKIIENDLRAPAERTRRPGELFTLFASHGQIRSIQRAAEWKINQGIWNSSRRCKRVQGRLEKTLQAA